MGSYRFWLLGNELGCQHRDDEFVGSFMYDEKHYDVYIFHQPSGKEVCIRYGNKDYEYISPGYLSEFVRRIESGENKNPVYHCALKIMERRH